MRKSRMYLLLVIIFLSLAVLFLVLTKETKEDSLIEQGNQLVIKIEEYKKDRGKFPISLAEINIQEKLEGPIYYELKDSTRFILWFGTTLGESVTYDSRNRKWE